MMKLIRPVALALLGLSLFSCDKEEVLNNGSDPKLAQADIATRFELNSSLGSVEMQSLSNNTSGADDDLRATLHFKGTNKLTTTSLKPSDFGLRMGESGNSLNMSKINARWGVIHGDAKEFAGANCSSSVTEAPANPSSLTANTVYFIPSLTTNTIEGAELKMYCQSSIENKDKIKQAVMCLDGVEGQGSDASKQYFMTTLGSKTIATDPNDRIEGVKLGSTELAMQEKRHIPVMTPLAPYTKITATTPTIKFAPRGSIFGLCIKNKLAEEITVTGIVVSKTAGALDYSGYFDLAQTTTVKNDGVAEERPNFVAQYPSSSSSALVFPVYTKGASIVGYQIPVFQDGQNEMTELSCLFVWGFQKADKRGEDFKVQIRYKLGTASDELTTRTFNIHPRGSIFGDGYAYNTILTIDASNKTGGMFPNENPTEPVKKCSELQSKSLNFTTPLDFVAEMPAINKAGTGFVKNHCYPHTGDAAELYENEVGYFSLEQVNKLFTEKVWLKNSGYYLPSREQWHSIVPDYSSNHEIKFNRERPKSTLKEIAQVGNTQAKEYTSDFISVPENGKFVTYAHRFKGTKWESAWRYSYEAYENERAKSRMVIKCVPLKGANAGKTLEQIKNVSFFTDNPCSVRFFPCYGYLSSNRRPLIIATFGLRSKLWGGRSATYNKATQMELSDEGADVSNFYKGNLLPIRPFRKKS